jgi:hypothetical protein
MDIFSDISSNTLIDRGNDNNTDMYFQNMLDRYLLGSFLLENQEQPDIMNTSLNQENRYKIVISDEGKKLLKIEKYTKPGCCLNEICPISQEEFTDGDNITILPCNHGFTTGAVEKWLETQCPECPICRYKMDSIEVKNKDYCEVTELPITLSRNTFFNSLSSLENITHPFGRNQLFNTIPHSYLENIYRNRLEDDDANEA